MRGRRSARRVAHTDACRSLRHRCVRGRASTDHHHDHDDLDEHEHLGHDLEQPDHEHDDEQLDVEYHDGRVATTTTSTLATTDCGGIPVGPTFGSIACRLAALLARVHAEAGFGTFEPK